MTNKNKSTGKLKNSLMDKIDSEVAAMPKLAKVSARSPLANKRLIEILSKESESFCEESKCELVGYFLYTRNKPELTDRFYILAGEIKKYNAGLTSKETMDFKLFVFIRRFKTEIKSMQEELRSDGVSFNDSLAYATYKSYALRTLPPMNLNEEGHAIMRELGESLIEAGQQMNYPLTSINQKVEEV